MDKQTKRQKYFSGIQTDRQRYLGLLQAGHPGGEFERVLLGARFLAPKVDEDDKEGEDGHDATDHAEDDWQFCVVPETSTTHTLLWLHQP